MMKKIIDVMRIGIRGKWKVISTLISDIAMRIMVNNCEVKIPKTIPNNKDVKPIRIVSIA